jgi:hypothetical protein
MSTGNIRGLIQALPQFREVLGRLSVHIFVSSELKNALNARSLTDLGELEQNLIYGDANSQDLIKFLSGELRVQQQREVCLLLIEGTWCLGELCKQLSSYFACCGDRADLTCCYGTGSSQLLVSELHLLRPQISIQHLSLWCCC